MKKLIKSFIDSEGISFQEEAIMALELCEEANDYHMVSYWISGTYQLAERFLNENYSSELLDAVLEMYPNNLDDLIKKVNSLYGKCSRNRLILEALCTMLLKEYQRYSIWYTVYGSEEEDMIDFDKYHILNALEDNEEFPVMKSEDLVAAMYGINYTVQPSDMYDVFAHYADELEIKKDTGFLEAEEKVNTFTPDTFLIAGIVGRWKQYTDLTNNNKKVPSDYALTFCETENMFSTFSKYIEDKERAYLYADIIKNDYMNRFATPPNGLPLHSDMLSTDIVEKEGEVYIHIVYSIRGIENKANAWKHFGDSLFKVPNSPKELSEIIFNVATEMRKRIVGMEKEKGGTDAIEGEYPIRKSASHGLNFIKDLNVKIKNNRGITEKKIAKPTFSLALAEKQSLYFIKKALRYGTINPILSTSFGIDSTITHHLIRRVSKSAYYLLHNDSLVEYPDLLLFKREQIKKLNLENRITETKPIKTYWQLKEEQGWNFHRKGDRRKKGNSNSENCCKFIKHIPAQNYIDKLIEMGNPMQVNFSGLRAAESRARLQQSKRDNLVYYAKSWKTIRVNPIAFFTDEMVWEYVKKYNVEYCKVYDMKLYYEDVFDNINEDEFGKVYYQPRVGCYPCLVTQSALPGAYLKWILKYYPSMYNVMMFKQGLVTDLFEIGAKKLGIISDNILVEKPKSKDGQVSLFDIEEETRVTSSTQLTSEQILAQYPIEMMEQWIHRRPCKFTP